jgi:hypothetical protein
MVAGAFHLAPVGYTAGREIVVGKISADRLSHRRIIIYDQYIARAFGILVHIFDSYRSSGTAPSSSLRRNSPGRITRAAMSDCELLHISQKLYPDRLAVPLEW